MFPDIYNQKITILNKLNKKDSVTGLDVWHKFVIEDAAWYTEVERNVGVSGVIIGTVITVLIPFHDEYLEYREWCKLGMQEGHYTVSEGDYIVLGDVGELITPNNVVKTMNSYGESVCQVKYHRLNHDRFGARIQLKIEGV